jgi:hypothetical protein
MLNSTFILSRVSIPGFVLSGPGKIVSDTIPPRPRLMHKAKMVAAKNRNFFCNVLFKSGVNKNMRYIKFLIVLFLASSCTKDDVPTISCSSKTNQIDDVKKLITGTYDWVYTIDTYRIGGEVIETPFTTRVKYTYVFKSNGNVDFFVNDTLKWSNKFVVDYEFKVSTYPSDSATIVIINNTVTGQRQEFFRPYLCNDTAVFYNPSNSLSSQRYFKRN